MPDFKLIPRDQIDDGRWNRTVLNDDHFRHYALTYYLDGATDRWQALIANDYSWVWPLPIRVIPLNRTVQPLLAQQLGPYGETLSEDKLQELWAWISERFWQSRVKFNDKYASLPFKHSKHINIEIQLDDPEKALSRFNRNAKGNLSKADKASVSVAVESNFSFWLIETFKQSKAKDIASLGQSFYRSVRTIYEVFEQRGEAMSYYAYCEGQKVAGVMLLTTNDRLLFFFSSSTEMGKKVGAMHAILRKIILDHAATNKTLDMEGSDNEKLAFFYKSFGGEVVEYLEAEKDRLFWPLNKLMK